MTGRRNSLEQSNSVFQRGDPPGRNVAGKPRLFVRVHGPARSQGHEAADLLYRIGHLVEGALLVLELDKRQLGRVVVAESAVDIGDAVDDGRVKKYGRRRCRKAGINYRDLFCLRPGAVRAK
jgi:hypothetical protein